jgi:ribonucleoside-diphosphate reductase alpha chain
MSIDTIYVLKRDGTKEALDFEKIHKVLEWATEGLSNVSYSTIELKAKLQFTDGVSTADIHSILAKTSADLITADNPNYQFVASRLRLFALRKEVFGKFTPPHVLKLVNEMVAAERYTDELLEWYSEEEFDEMNNFINHQRDFSLSWAAVKQMEGKYLRKNRVTGQIYETPQFLYMMIAATIFSSYPKKKRMGYVKKYYNAISEGELSLPTPIMAGLRTPVKQFSSCVLIEAGDSLPSINATSNAITSYISQKAGIGVNAGAIRGLGSSIRNGEAFHTGVIPFYRLFQSAVKSCSQGGVRGGAATLYVPAWHSEIMEIMVLKNNKGTDDNRVRHLDYGIQFNGFLYQRLIEGKNISLFSPSEVPGLYEAFFADQDKFKEMYKKYEADKTIRRKEVSALELFERYILERQATGRIYFQNVDHCNEFGPFKPEVAPIKQSNLCLEIALPTKPLQSFDDPEGEIALCTLSAFNLGKIPDFDLNNKEEAKEALSRFEDIADLAVRALDAILSYQEYPVPAAKKSTMLYRPLGIGVVNYAYLLAKHGVTYSETKRTVVDEKGNETIVVEQPALKLTHQVMEAIQYYTMKASINLAKEQGACKGFKNTKLSEGSLPIDRYKKDVDQLLDDNDANFHLQDWEALRKDLLKYGIRNATLTALMPSETSSQILNATNGIEAPRDLVSVKASKDGILKQVVPGVEDPEVRWNYELLWDQENPIGYIKLVAVMQKFVDQAISGNTAYNPNHFEGNKFSTTKLLRDMLTCYKYGWKTGYYFNTNDVSNNQDDDDDDCDSCKI